MRWGEHKKCWWNEPWSQRVPATPHLKGTHFLVLVEKYLKSINKYKPAPYRQRAIQKIALQWQRPKLRRSNASCWFSIQALWGSATRTEAETSKLSSLTITAAAAAAACVTPRLPTTFFSDLKQPVQSGNDDFGVTQWWWACSATPPRRHGRTSIKNHCA